MMLPFSALVIFATLFANVRGEDGRASFAIYPGDNADDYDDLGILVEVDKCCREHDHCPDVILASETKHNLTNSAFYSRLSCKCDQVFFKCLKNVDSRDSGAIGLIYFNTIRTQCFRKDYPIVSCAKQSIKYPTKCVEYEYDTSRKRVMQWFDVPEY